MRKQIGHFFVEKGLLTDAEVTEIRKHSEASKKKFGESAIELGYLTQEQLKSIFGPNWEVDFFHLDPFTFPPATQNLFTVDEIIKHGVLGLGYKTSADGKKETKYVNIGLLDPGNESNVKAVFDLIKSKVPRDAKGKSSIQAMDLYLLLPEQFLNVLEQVYKVSTDKLNRKSTDAIDPTLLAALAKMD